VPDDIFEGKLAPLVRCERGGHFNPAGSFDFDAFEFAQMQVADPNTLHQKRADSRLVGALARDIDDIRGFNVGGFDRLTADRNRGKFPGGGGVRV